MELTFRKADMAEAMRAVSGAIGKSPMPILANLLISTAYDPLPGLLKSEADGKIYLAGTDLEIGIRASIPGQVTEGGAITVPARKFAAMVREMSDSDIHLATTSADRVNVDCGSAKFRLTGLPAEEFPSLIPEASPEPQQELIDEKDVEKTDFISMDAKTLAAMIQRTSYAASKDEIRHFLNGVHLSMKPDGESGCLVKMAATDGKRLAVATAKVEATVGIEKQGIIPIKAVEHLRNMLMSSGVVKINMDASRIIFDMDDRTLVSRLVEGDYPDYEKAIPTENSIKLTVETQRLLSIVKRIGTMANSKTPGLTIEITGDVLKVKASTPEYGEGYEETSVKKEGDDISIGLNAQYLMDILSATDRNEVLISMSDPLKPVLMKPVGNDGYVCVIMPMRL